MRLKYLELKEELLLDKGLKEFYSSKFNSIFALVGKNGSGKTRYLKAIENRIKNIGIEDVYNGKFDFLPNDLFVSIIPNERFLPIYKAYKELIYWQNKQKTFPKDNIISQKLSDARIKYSKFPKGIGFNPNEMGEIEARIRKEITKRLKVITPSDLRALKPKLDLTNNKITFQDIIDSTQENIEINELTTISEGALAYLQRLPHKLTFDSIDTKGDEKKFKARVSYKRFKLLRDLIQEFLGKNLDWESKDSKVDEYDDHVQVQAKGFWKIDGREFNYSDFSDGERVLFTYAILFFLLNLNPNIKFSESIIIIDEPELNLHPKAQIKLIDSIQNLIKGQGQLIIATHSLSIVANLDYGSIFLVKEGELFAPSSSVPFDSVDELMGFEEHYNKIVEFLASTPSWAMTNFMAQCFDSPEVFGSASKNDPQLEVFKKLLQENNINILDFGSGKGRLIDRIREQKDIWDRITAYDCFDIETSYNDLVIKKGAATVLNKLEDIEEKKYDLVIVVNVLHEIHIEHWAKSLNKIKKTLKPEGFVAIIEDLHLPIGELPNDVGFLLMGKTELKKLLGDEISFITPTSERYKDRIICGVISGDNMNRIDKNKLLSVLEELKKNSLKSIKDYREQENKNVGLGRLYALKSNLYVNSELAIQFLNK